MSGTIYPTQLDSDSELPRVDGNVTEVGEDAINSARSAIFSIEGEVGIGGRGTLSSIADRIAVSLNNDGTIKTSSLLGIGLVALPITNSQISATAGVVESKLALNYSTTSLYNLYTALQSVVDTLSSFLSLTGIKLQPHIDGTDDRHFLSHIDIDPSAVLLKPSQTVGAVSPGNSVVNRNITNLKTLAEDLSNDLTTHEKSDGTAGVSSTTGGTVPPTNYAHNAAGVYINTTNFSSIPQSNNDVQKIANFIDSSSLLLIGGRTQNLFSNGVSRGSRSTPLLKDGYGSGLVPPTPITAYLLSNPPGPTSSVPIDDISNGDDIVLFNPTTDQLAGFVFDSQFSLVRPGDLLTINYGTGISYQFVIESTKDLISGGNRTFAVRINGRNPFSASAGFAQIDKALFNRNKHNALANVRVPNSTGEYETLIVASPRGAMTLGINFNPSQINSSHYKLYLGFLQNGDSSSIVILPGVDVTGNKGTTPGQYNIDNLIDATNTAFRANGFNFRFVAFKHDGQFGIAMADHYHNSGFSIIAGNVDNNGNYTSVSNAVFTKNIIDNFNGIDPLGFGASGANLASPPPGSTYASAISAKTSPTIIFSPLKKNFYYVNGIERDTLYSDPLNLTSFVDSFGDGYWPATILPAPATHILSDRVETVYQVSLDISQSSIRAGKTIVVQPDFAVSDSRFNLRDYGRYTVKSVAYYNCGQMDGYGNITVYDSVYGAGTSPAPVSTSIPVNLYFSDDSVMFNAQNVADSSVIGQFKRYFESYIDKTGHTFTHERARFIISGAIGNINFCTVSPKLRGYAAGNYREIRLLITSFDDTTGNYTGNLARWNYGTSTYSNLGPTVSGKKGEVVRFYDETNIDYIEFAFDLITAVSAFSNQTIDIQLFSSLALDQEDMLLSTCQMNDNTKKMTHLQDRRQFGNISEEHLSTSAIDFIAAVSKAVMKNRTISGFGNYTLVGNTISLTGGTALIEGKLVLANNSSITMPVLRETIAPAFSSFNSVIDWILCVNKQGQMELIVDTTNGTADRLFYAINPNQTSSTPYPIRASTLTNLVANLTDVTPLYSLETTVTGSGTTWTMSTITNVDQRIAVAKI